MIIEALPPEANSAGPPLTPEVEKLILSGDSRFSAGDLDAALQDYLKVLTLRPKAPNTRFKSACIYSIKKDVVESFR